MNSNSYSMENININLNGANSFILDTDNASAQISKIKKGQLREVYSEGERQKANEVFKNIFMEIFLSNCGNPINFDQTAFAFNNYMGGFLTDQQMTDLHRLFASADLTNVSYSFIFTTVTITPASMTPNGRAY